MPRPSEEDGGYPHCEAPKCYPRAQPLTYSGCFPKETTEPGAIVEDGRELHLDVGAGADHQQHHYEEGVEVEQRRHGAGLLLTELRLQDRNLDLLAWGWGWGLGWPQPSACRASAANESVGVGVAIDRKSVV